VVIILKQKASDSETRALISVLKWRVGVQEVIFRHEYSDIARLSVMCREAVDDAMFCFAQCVASCRGVRYHDVFVYNWTGTVVVCWHSISPYCRIANFYTMI